MTPLATRRPLHLTATILVALLVVSNLTLIFSFSSESRSDSASRSRAVTEVVARVMTPHFDELSLAEREATVDHLHHYVRKAAHFSEFALLGWLTALLARLAEAYIGCRSARWRSIGLPALFCLLTAISDEVYQIFTHRGSSATDVLIDFSGAVCGVALLHTLLWLIVACTRRRNRKEIPAP